MEKTRIGIPAPFIAAAIYLSALFSGYLLTGLLVGYVLLCEKDRSLKTHAVCAFSLLLAFSLINCAVYLLPDMFDVVSDLLAVFNVYFYPSFISRVLSFFGSTLSLLKTLAFLAMTVLAIVKNNIRIPLLNKLFQE